MTAVGLLWASIRQIFEAYAAAGAEIRPRPLDPAQEPGIVEELVLEPVVLGSEPDQYAGRLAIVGAEDLYWAVKRTLSSPTTLQ